MPFRLTSTEITVKKSGLRIGYDYLQTKHALLLDVDTLILTAKPLEEGQNDALTVQARIPYRFKRSDLSGDTIVIHPESLAPVTPRLESLSEVMALAGVVRGGEWREEKNDLRIRVSAPFFVRIEPEHRHVLLTLGSTYTKKAEYLQVEAVKPTLVNILLDRVQAAVILYAQPAEAEVRYEGDKMRVRLMPMEGEEKLRATSEN